MKPSIARRGIIFALSSPSGAGKTTIASAVMDQVEDLQRSISYTTRPKRPGEKTGFDYYFVDTDEFQQRITEDFFLEHARVFENYYGTPKAAVYEALINGKDLVFDIDWQGVQQIKQYKNQDVVSIFILPPDKKTLKERLSKRRQDSEEVIDLRMSRAVQEMSHWTEYDYVIINDDLDKAVKQTISIIHAERMKRWRQIDMVSFVKTLTPDAD